MKRSTILPKQRENLDILLYCLGHLWAFPYVDLQYLKILHISTLKLTYTIVSNFSESQMFIFIRVVIGINLPFLP